MPAPLKTAVVGVTGYAGFELSRLLLRHPRVSRSTLFHRATEGMEAKQLSDFFPQVSGNGGYAVEPFSWSKLRPGEVDLLLLATPHEVSREWVPEAVQRGVRVTDLSGAWRLRQADHRVTYGFQDTDPATAQRLTDQAVYGLPELNRKRLREAQLVANPGCYPATASRWARI